MGCGRVVLFIFSLSRKTALTVADKLFKWRKRTQGKYSQEKASVKIYEAHFMDKKRHWKKSMTCTLSNSQWVGRLGRTRATIPVMSFPPPACAGECPPPTHPPRTPEACAFLPERRLLPDLPSRCTRKTLPWLRAWIGAPEALPRPGTLGLAEPCPAGFSAAMGDELCLFHLEHQECK